MVCSSYVRETITKLDFSLRFLMSFIRGIKVIGHAPLIGRKTLARLQYSINLLIAAKLEWAERALEIYEKGTIQSKDKLLETRAQEFELADYHICCMTCCFYSIYCIKSIIGEWHFHEVSLHIWEVKIMEDMNIILNINQEYWIISLYSTSKYKG